MQAAHRSITETLGPRCRTLTDAARAKARKALATAYTDESRLELAIEQSDLVREFSIISPTVTDNPSNGTVAYAKSLLDLSNRLDEMEKKLS